MPVNIVLLAAGKGERFSQNNASKIKQLAIYQGVTLIEHTMAQLTPVINKLNLFCQTVDPALNLELGQKLEQKNSQPKSKLYITLGAHHDEIISTLPKNTSILVSDNWQLGMRHSLADSIQYIAPVSSHVLIALVDQPLITKEHYQALIDASKLNPNNIIATLAKNIHMAPAIFPKKHFAELMELHGDNGAGKILKKHIKDVKAVAFHLAQYDVDTPEQLVEIQQ